MKEKKLLYEVSIIRPLIIFLLVVLHSFAPIIGSWEAIKGVETIPAYYWLCKFIQGFRIETIALIAGYVFAFQSIDLGRKYDFLPFAWKKVKRLIIPCIAFSLAYFLLFNYEQHGNLRFLRVIHYQNCRRNRNGNHLWYGISTELV